MTKFSKKQEYLFVWIGFTLLVFILLLSTGTITSGWHLVDDHEYIEYQLEINNPEGSLLGCIKNVLKADFTSRFRPLYYILRVLGTALFGTNLIIWSIIRAIVTILALVFLYLDARSLKCNIFYSILFSLVVMVGPQSVVWWKLGPQECTGIFLFAIGFLYVNKWLQTNKKKYAILSILLLFSDSLYKESFIMLLPFVIFYIIYYHCMDTGFEINIVLRAIKQSWKLLLPLLIILVTDLLIIILLVGTNNVTYVGFDPAFTLKEYYDSWRIAYYDYLKYFIFFSIPAIMIIITFYREWKVLLPRILLFLSIIIPQLIIHCKTGLEERYIIPFSFGFAGLFIASVCTLKSFSGISKTIYTCLVLVFLIPHFIILVNEANYYTYRGHSVTTVLNQTLATSEPGKKILAAYSPYTESDITVAYWLLLNGCEQVYMWDESEKTCTIRTGPLKGTSGNIGEMDIILFYNPQDRHYCYDPDIDLTNYNRVNYGTLTMCSKK